MAIVRGPLFSLGATQKLAKALVYASWKGIKTVREYVIPSNPRTPAQLALRALFDNAVQDWERGLMLADDKSAWNLLASVGSRVMSGFNRFVGAQVQVTNAGDPWLVLESGTITPGLGQLAVSAMEEGGAGGSTVNIHWGTTPTAMNSSQNCPWVPGASAYQSTILGLSAGVTYYLQFRNSNLAVSGAFSGIFTGIPT